MNLVNKKVVHRTFGEGNVVSHNEDYINIDFESNIKKFVFPDVFGEYMTLTDQKEFTIIKMQIQEQEEKRKKEALRLKREQALQQEYQRTMEQKTVVKKPGTNPELQSAFWCKAEEVEEVFTEWKVFVGEIKNGIKKGQPRKLSRMNQKSACLLTRRESDMPEKNRRILGVFMAEEDFNGKTCSDGYIPAHPDHRLHLSEQESQKMLFWNYYVDEKFPKMKTWNSGRHRYFANIWMAQILQDIVSLREESEEQKKAQLFFEHFCKSNHIDVDELPKPNGALVR